MHAAATHDEDAAIPVFEHLKCQMSGSAKAVESYGRAGYDARTFDRTKADDAGTEQRRGMFVVDVRRQA